MKVWKLDQLRMLDSVDSIVLDKTKEMLEVLVDNYGTDGLGGYILVEVTKKEAFNEFINQYPSVIPEFIEYFNGTDDVEYVELLFLLGSDYHVMVYLKAEEFKADHQSLINTFNELDV